MYVATKNAISSAWFREEDMPAADTGIRKGQITRSRGFYEPDAGVAAWFARVTQFGDYYSPRHKHDDEQLRYMLRGSMGYGREVQKAGDLVYIPEGVSYGPLNPPENASESDKDAHFVNLSFPGASTSSQGTWSRYLINEENLAKARRELEKNGKIEGGVFRRSDGTNSDAFEAMSEIIMGQKPQYPSPRVVTYCVMHTGLYAWQPSGLKGLAVRELASFFETGPRIRMLELQAGTSLPAVTKKWQQAWFLIDGEIKSEDTGSETFGAPSFRYVAPNTVCPSVTAVTMSVALLVEWARLGERMSSANDLAQGSAA